MSYKLYHFPLCPFSRKVRVFLTECSIPFQMVPQNPWNNKENILAIDPIQQLPILVKDKITMTQSQAICEYIEEERESSLIGDSTIQRYEIRKIISIIEGELYFATTKPTLQEKVLSFFENTSPNSSAMQKTHKNITRYYTYMESLVTKNIWLTGDSFSLADISLAAQISVLDYLNDIDWQDFRKLREWYSIIKSKPSFQDILNDHVQGFKPSEHYSNCDF